MHVSGGVQTTCVAGSLVLSSHYPHPMNAPKAFLSHASEDKDAFVVEFATKLRTSGVDVWLDQWEIKAGDSIVSKVFTQGIEQASVFIVVLSKVSVTKPWVAEELDASVIRKIQEGTKLIPVVLEDVVVPSALKHLRYVSVPSLGLDGAVADVVASIFAKESRPPLGVAPTYATQPQRLLPDATDDAILHVLIELALERGQVSGNADEVRARAAEIGIDATLADEAIDALVDQRIIKVMHTFGSYFVSSISDRAWIAAARARGVPVDEAYDHLLVHIVNVDDVGNFDEVDELTRDALVGLLESNRLVKIAGRTSGSVFVHATVEGKRRAREL